MQQIKLNNTSSEHATTEFTTASSNMEQNSLVTHIQTSKSSAVNQIQNMQQHSAVKQIQNIHRLPLAVRYSIHLPVGFLFLLPVNISFDPSAALGALIPLTAYLGVFPPIIDVDEVGAALDTGGADEVRTAEPLAACGADEVGAGDSNDFLGFLAWGGTGGADEAGVADFLDAALEVLASLAAGGGGGGADAAAGLDDEPWKISLFSCM